MEGPLEVMENLGNFDTMFEDFLITDPDKA